MDGSGQIWAAQHAGQPVWLSDDREAWVAGVIDEVAAGERLRIKVGTAAVDVKLEVDGRCAKTHGLRVVPRDVSQKGAGLENMDDLAHLNEACVLHNVSARFADKKIYTRTGPILVAMNPFEWLPIYGPDTMAAYREAGHRVDDELPPHCFAEAQKAYTALVSSGASQSLIICGESGAGKTETTKLMLEFLSNNYTEEANLGIAERIMKSNPLLEAFGNAKTLRNRNSSRFGKFIQLGFQDKSIQGAHVSNYLLEKSRTVRQNKHERNYHIFYQLCRGADPKRAQDLGLGQDLRAFRYLNQSGCVDVQQLDDAAEFLSTVDALKAIDVPAPEIDATFRVVAAILHLGNVQFGKAAHSVAGTTQAKARSISVASDDSSAPAEVAFRGSGDRAYSADVEVEESKAAIAEDVSEGEPNEDAALRRACELLGCDTARLAHALTVKYVTVNGKAIESPLDNRKAADLRDALAKSIYSQLFSHIVGRVNACLDRGAQKSLQMFIGILDIYGFESFQENGFEQLLINFANEKLQSLFNEQVFRAEEAMYNAEGVPFSRTEIPDNEKCITLVQGIFKLMHDECLRMSAGSDRSLAGQITQQYKAHPNFGVCGPGSRRKGTTEVHFAIVHYAGEIIYTCSDFIKKNRDTLYPHVETIMAASRSPLVAKLFQAGADDEDAAGNGGGAKPRATASKLQETVAKAFAAQVNVLTETIRSTNPIFVRCIKTNNELVSNKVDRLEVLRQLKNAGVIAALEMRRAGFPNRLAYKDFCLRCRALLPRDARVGDSHWRVLAENLFTSSPIACWRDQVSFGQTRVFLRANILHEVDSVVQQHVTEQVISVQSIVRQFLHAKRFRTKRRLAIWAQARFRGYLTRRELEAQIRTLEAKRSWFARSARFASLQKELRRLEARRAALAPVQAPGLDVVALEKALELCTAETEVAADVMAAQSDLAAADAVLDRLEAAIDQGESAAESLEKAVAQLEKRQAQLRAQLEDLRARFEAHLRTVEAATLELTFLKPPSRETRDPADLVEQLCSGYVFAREGAQQCGDDAKVAIAGFNLETGAQLLKRLDPDVANLEHIFAQALAKKREIEASFERLQSAALATRDALVKALRCYGAARQTHVVREVQDCVARARKEFARLCHAIGRGDLVASVETRAQVALPRPQDRRRWKSGDRGDSSSDDDDDDRSDDESDSNEDDDRLCSDNENDLAGQTSATQTVDIARVDVEEADIALVHANAAISDLQDAVTEAMEKLETHNASVAELRAERRASYSRIQSLDTRQESELRPADADLLFANQRVSQARGRLETLWAQADTIFSSATTSPLLSASDLDDAAATMRKVSSAVTAGTASYTKEVTRLRARLDRARARRDEAMKDLLPALDILKTTRALIARHRLDKRFKVQDAVRSVEVQVEEAQKLLTGSSIPSRAALEALPETMATVCDLVDACAQLVDEEYRLMSELRDEVAEAQFTAERVSRRLGRLEAQMMQHEVFETRSVRALCKASWCGAQVCNLANQVSEGVAQTHAALRRLSRKISSVDGLRACDSEDQEEILSRAVKAVAGRAEACCATAEAALVELISLRAEEVDFLEASRADAEQKEMRCDRARGIAETLRREDLYMPLQARINEAAEAIAEYQEGVAYLTAREPEALALDDLYRAATSAHSGGSDRDPVEVLLFVKADPVQVIKEARERADFALVQAESAIATQTAFVAECAQLEAGRAVRADLQKQLEREEAEVCAARLREVRAAATLQLEPARRLVATVSELNALGYCETLSTEALAQASHVTYCLALYEDAVGRGDPDLAREQADMVLAEAAKLHTLMFARAAPSDGAASGPRRPSKWSSGEAAAEDCGTGTSAAREPRRAAARFACASRIHEDAARVARDAALKTRHASVFDLSERVALERARWRALKAEVELRAVQVHAASLAAVAAREMTAARAETESQDLQSRWAEAVEAAAAALDCAEARVLDIAHLSSASAMVLHTIDREMLDSRAAREAREAWTACESAVRFARDQVTKAEVVFGRSQRLAARNAEIRVRTRRVAFKHFSAASF